MAVDQLPLVPAAEAPFADGVVESHRRRQCRAWRAPLQPARSGAAASGPAGRRRRSSATLGGTMHFLLRALAGWPLPLLYGLSAVLSFVTFDILRWRREQVDRDLALAFPERTPAERRAIRNDTCRRFTDLFVEMIWGARADAAELVRRVVFENPEVITAAAARGQSVVLLAAHQCNWEWLLLSGGITFGFPIDAVYQPQRLAGLDRFLRETRVALRRQPDPAGRLRVRAHEPVGGVARLRADRRPDAAARGQEVLDADAQPRYRFLRRRREDRALPRVAGALRRDAPAAARLLHGALRHPRGAAVRRHRRRADHGRLRARARSLRAPSPRRLAVAAEALGSRPARAGPARRGRPHQWAPGVRRAARATCRAAVRRGSARRRWRCRCRPA